MARLQMIEGGRVGPPPESLEKRRSDYRMRLVAEIRTKAWDLPTDKRRRYYLDRLHVWDDDAQGGSFHGLLSAVMDIRREHRRLVEGLMQPGDGAA